MDNGKRSISPRDLYARLGSEAAPIIVDVRRNADFATADTLVADAFHCSPDDVEEWRNDLPNGRQVVTYCIHGQQASQGVAAALRLMGVEADFLEDGIAGWTGQGLPTRRNIGASPSKWVTREHPKIDRIACPWLIRRFIDPNAEFIYVPKEQVLAVAQRTGGIPYDINAVEFTHEGERCSFDTILRVNDINDPALDHLATIVRGADTSRHDPEMDRDLENPEQQTLHVEPKPGVARLHWMSGANIRMRAKQGSEDFRRGRREA